MDGTDLGVIVASAVSGTGAVAIIARFLVAHFTKVQADAGEFMRSIHEENKDQRVVFREELRTTRMDFMSALQKVEGEHSASTTAALATMKAMERECAQQREADRAAWLMQRDADRAVLLEMLGQRTLVEPKRVAAAAPPVPRARLTPMPPREAAGEPDHDPDR